MKDQAAITMLAALAHEHRHLRALDRAQVVDDALTEHLNATIDAAVEDGKLTEERAAKAKEHVDQAVDRILDADGSGAGRQGLRDRIKGRFGN